MEIRRKSYNKTVEYHMITRGECFALSDEIGTIYMKISPIEDRDYKGWTPFAFMMGIFQCSTIFRK